MTRVLLVEDEPLWQQAIGALLATRPGFQLVGVADDFDSALALYQAERPDVVLLDWRIRGLKDGLAVGSALEAMGHAAHRMILVSGSERSLIPHNAYGYVPKHRVAEDLIQHIEEAIQVDQPAST